MSVASWRSKPAVICFVAGTRRSGLSRLTVEVLRPTDPGGYNALIAEKLTTGPLTSIGSVGNRPLLGPGSAALAGKFAVNDELYVPVETKGVVVWSVILS